MTATIAELRARLEARRPGLDQLATGRGEPLDLAAAALKDTPRDAAVAAVRGAVQLDPQLRDGRVLDATGTLREDRLAFVVALARVAAHVPDLPVVSDRVDDVRYDVGGRPGAWRELSDHALVLGAACELAGQGHAGRLLETIARAALDAPSPAVLARADATITRLRRRARLSAWTTWLRDAGRALGDAAASLAEAADRVAAGAVPLAAADGPSPAEARVLLGELLDGEVTLAVTASGLVLEWDGEGEPPDAATLQGRALEPAPGSTAAPAAWWLGEPPDGTLRVRLTRGAHRAELPWG